MISTDSIKTVLGITGNVDLGIDEMRKSLIVTFYPHKGTCSDTVNKFAGQLESCFKDLGIKILPFNDVWEKVSLRKRIRRLFKYCINNFVWIKRRLLRQPRINFFLSVNTILKLSSKWRIKKGITIICSGEQETDNLVMQHITNFKTNSVITLVDLPKHITKESDFNDHFNASMSMFAYHMTNIIIAVGNDQWLTYNFNASHPSFSNPDPQFKEHVLGSIVPKIAAPISPHKLSEFIILDQGFDYGNPINKHAIDDMISGAEIFAKTGLFPDGKSIDSLPFRSNFHRLIGKLHLDNRSGMSFGYIAYQLPTKIYPIVSLTEFRKDHKESFFGMDYYVSRTGQIYLLHEHIKQKLVLRVPAVWVMTVKSGANKTNINKNSDLIKIGLINGAMYMQLPKGCKRDNTYKPSFDTKVILAHAVCNALVASLSKYIKRSENFSKMIQKNGISISHWHGYFNEKLLPKFISVYGKTNPHVSCSSPQSAIYAFQGKIDNIFSKLELLEEHVGDIHIEPHHGINVTYPSLKNLANYVLLNKESTKLGNKYL
jgi:hypothetical protein